MIKSRRRSRGVAGASTQIAQPGQNSLPLEHKDM